VPTYSYACTECDDRFDIVQSFTDDTLTVYPACSGKLRKLFNSVGIVFKGTGFYRNDSRGSGSSSEKATADSGAKSDGGAKSEGASGAEPAKRPDVAAAKSDKAPASTSSSKSGSTTSAPAVAAG